MLTFARTAGAETGRFKDAQAGAETGRFKDAQAGAEAGQPMATHDSNTIEAAGLCAGRNHTETS